MAKIKIYEDIYGEKSAWFHCPGCKNAHSFIVKSGTMPGAKRPLWSWNGSLERPTFTPSLLCNGDHPPSRCHSFVTDGFIRFLGDCHHDLKNKVVEIPEWDD